MITRTMSPREEADWLRAVEDGSLWPFRYSPIEQAEDSEQMWRASFGDPRLPERFWNKVRVLPNGCWEWTAFKAHGYGRFRVGSYRNGSARSVLAHRWAYQNLIGSIPVGLQPDHTCHNGTGCPGGDDCPHRACVNVAHIELVTAQENVLRGSGVAAQQARRTHCPRGHAYDPVNTYLNNGKRHCRQCRRQSGHLLKEIGRVTGLTEASVWARVRAFEERV